MAYLTYEQIAQQLFNNYTQQNLYGVYGQQANQYTPPIASAAEQIAQLNQKLKSMPKRKTAAEQIKEIEHELDIIKGRVPTPKGYITTPEKVKSLLLQLKKLQAK